MSSILAISAWGYSSKTYRLNTLLEVGGSCWMSSRSSSVLIFARASFSVDEGWKFSGSSSREVVGVSVLYFRW